MSQAKLVAGGLLILDFLFGIIFGVLGHLFSLCCFPFLALIRGAATALALTPQSSESFYKKAAVSAGLGAVVFYIGMIIGVLILIFVAIPNVPSLKQSMGDALSTTAGVLGGIGGGLVCGIGYMAIYVGVVMAAAWATKQLTKK